MGKKTKDIPLGTKISAMGGGRLYKVMIEKLIIGKPKPSPRDRLMARRVVVVSASTIALGVDHLRATLTAAGAFENTTGVILEVQPASECVVLSS